jgi:hypothetical protein
MTKLTLLGTAAVLSLTFATSLPAQAVIHESAACPLTSQAPADAAPPAPSARWLPPGCETSTMPWSAPVGHRQPQAADVPQATSPFELILDEENARVDRVVRGVCRGC